MKILVVDDHEMFAESIELLLSSRHQITTVADGKAAIGKISEQRPGIVVLDQQLPDIDGLTLLKVIRALPDPPPVLMLSASEDAAIVSAARHTGAVGFLNKSSPASVLVEAIEKIEAGLLVWPQTPDGCEHLKADRSHHQAVLDVNLQIMKELGITDRQLDVLRLLVAGLPNKVIADQLGIAESTVKTHVKSLFQVLKVANRGACQNRARDLGLVQ